MHFKTSQNAEVCATYSNVRQLITNTLKAKNQSTNHISHVVYNDPFCPLTFLGQYLHLLCTIRNGYFCHLLTWQHSIVLDSVLVAVHSCILLSTPARAYVYKIYKLLLLYLSTNKIYALQNCATLTQHTLNRYKIMIQCVVTTSTNVFS